MLPPVSTPPVATEASSASADVVVQTKVDFSFATPLIAAAAWSTVECVDLQISGALGLAGRGRVGLFWVTHLAIGLAASLVLLVLFHGAVARVRTVAQRFNHKSEQAMAAAKALVLFVFHAVVWVAACWKGLPPRRDNGLLMACGVVALAAAGWLLRRLFLAQGARSTSPRGDAACAALCFAAMFLAHILNREVLSKNYFLLHVAVTLHALTVALFGAGYLLRNLERSPRLRTPVRVVIACAIVVAPFALFAVSNDIRHALFTRAFDARSLVYLARKLPGAGFNNAIADQATKVSQIAASASYAPTTHGKWVDRVLLITIDTLRSDHLPFYGYHRDTAPAMTEFQAAATTFEWAWAHGPATRYFIANVFGPRNQANLPASLRAAGLRQTALSTRGLDRALNNTAFDRAWLESSFDKVMTIERDDDLEIAQAAVSEIDAGRFPPFMWVHLMAPHDPYVARATNPFGRASVDLYDGEILESDKAVKNILAAVDRSQLAATTAVIISSDHGEEFGEHGGSKHATDVHVEQLRVPLLIRMPGFGPRRVPVNVSHQDIPVTIADLLGISLPPMGRARSLVPLITGGQFDTNRPIVIQPFATYSFMLSAAVLQNWKLNHSVFNGSFALYDLHTDPGEKVNLFEAEPDKAQLLREILTRPTALLP